MARILVIEDSRENLDLMGYLLTAFGHTPFGAVNGLQGIEIARSERPDLVICDIHLPELDGYEVARQLKTDPLLRSIPLVAVTALAMVGDRDKVLAAGFNGYLAKPIVPKKFIEQVENYLHASARGDLAPPALAVAANAAREALSAPSLPPLAATLWNGRHAQVLVVDDSPPNRELIRQTLEPAGFETRLAGTVDEGLLAARERVPELIVSDLHMPGQSGFDFIRQAKSDPRLAAVPFIIITSSVWAERDRETARELGAIHFITRPITAKALLEEIVACLPDLGASAVDEGAPGRPSI